MAQDAETADFDIAHPSTSQDPVAFDLTKDVGIRNGLLDPARGFPQVRSTG